MKNKKKEEEKEKEEEEEGEECKMGENKRPPQPLLKTHASLQFLLQVLCLVLERRPAGVSSVTHLHSPPQLWWLRSLCPCSGRKQLTDTIPTEEDLGLGIPGPTPDSFFPLA